MPLFGRKKQEPSSPALRSLPRLDPDFYVSIHERLVANGGTDSAGEIAYGVGNAIFNKGMEYFDRLGDRRAMRDFASQFEGRSPSDMAAADRMIDYLVSHSRESEEWLSTLVSRLDDVLSRPA